VAGQIPHETIQEVRERTDIVQVVGRYVQLRRSGSTFVGLCPFHEEKTPSFNVNPQRQFFHCFGCQESGDVFGFIMKLEGKGFVDVVQELADQAGVEIAREKLTPEEVRRSARRKSDRQRGLELCARVAARYREALMEPSGDGARAYLERRGISEASGERFLLGWAPRAGDLVAELARRAGVPLTLAEKVGLVAPRRAGGYRDRFWNRVIFPVRTVRGEAVAFGGRILEGDGPKYINSPETFLYRKGEMLYGLFEASRAIRRSGVAYLVEGNVDVIQMAQHGFENTVAPMGTALTESQVRLLSRLCDVVVAVFDGDSAGQAAAVKAVTQFAAGAVEARIATLPARHDPDSLLREEGADAMTQLLEAAPPAIDFLIDHYLQEMPDTIPGRVKLMEQLAPVLRQLGSHVARDMYLDKVADLLDLTPDLVRRAVRGARVDDMVARQVGGKAPATTTPVDRAELELLGILVEHGHLLPRAEAANVAVLLTNEDLRATYKTAVEMQEHTGEIQIAELLKAAPPGVKNHLVGLVNSGRWASGDAEDTELDPTKALDDCIRGLELRQLQQEWRSVMNEIKRAEDRQDVEVYQDLLYRSYEIKREIKDLEREIHETR